MAMLWLTPSSATASSVALPFSDRNTSGTIAFCDPHNKPVTSGKLTDIPFVWKAVSSSAAPPAWVGPMGKAALYVFQPRQNVDPGLWSGTQMTASAHYSNPKHPMTQATYGDPALIDFTSVAPLWQGLLQVRMYYTNVNTQVHRVPYPATIIKVDGNTWKVLNPSNAPCNAGTAVSSETVLLPPTALPTASPTYQGATPGPVHSASNSASANGSGSSSSSSPDAGGMSPGPTDMGASPAAASGTAASVDSGFPWVVALLSAVVLGGGGLFAGIQMGRKRAVSDAGSHSSNTTS